MSKLGIIVAVICIIMVFLGAYARFEDRKFRCAEYGEMKLVETKWTKTGCWIKNDNGTYSLGDDGVFGELNY